jgi:hypothetical protein
MLPVYNKFYIKILEELIEIAKSKNWKENKFTNFIILKNENDLNRFVKVWTIWKNDKTILKEYIKKIKNEKEEEIIDLLNNIKRNSSDYFL